MQALVSFSLGAALACRAEEARTEYAAVVLTRAGVGVDALARDERFGVDALAHARGRVLTRAGRERRARCRWETPSQGASRWLSGSHGDTRDAVAVAGLSVAVRRRGRQRAAPPQGTAREPRGEWRQRSLGLPPPASHREAPQRSLGLPLGNTPQASSGSPAGPSEATSSRGRAPHMRRRSCHRPGTGPQPGGRGQAKTTGLSLPWTGPRGARPPPPRLTTPRSRRCGDSRPAVRRSRLCGRAWAGNVRPRWLQEEGNVFQEDGGLFDEKEEEEEEEEGMESLLQVEDVPGAKVP